MTQKLCLLIVGLFLFTLTGSATTSYLIDVLVLDDDGDRETQISATCVPNENFAATVGQEVGEGLPLGPLINGNTLKGQLTVTNGQASYAVHLIVRKLEESSYTKDAFYFEADEFLLNGTAALGQTKTFDLDDKKVVVTVSESKTFPPQ
ncbi:hypothetical protein H5P28_15875 [Ruficoccus amylovorans]|uniref:Uncharacterized protein n=1 Tax=Ruficoccus amylovorans TaxID=1804625 RepID=A0A842HJJ4_9BACT|nr:hypothetical protein [Ruficoccus amylovorans]MBC2595746.1 hypothetical protein [Ruficoccus amylovorans]